MMSKKGEGRGKSRKDFKQARERTKENLIKIEIVSSTHKVPLVAKPHPIWLNFLKDGISSS